MGNIVPQAHYAIERRQLFINNVLVSPLPPSRVKTPNYLKQPILIYVSKP